jgi:hypothetical protein
MALLLWAIALTMSVGAHAASVNVAVAANFTEPAKEIAQLFQSKTANQAILSPANFIRKLPKRLAESPSLTGASGRAKFVRSMDIVRGAREDPSAKRVRSAKKAEAHRAYPTRRRSRRRSHVFLRFVVCRPPADKNILRACARFAAG